MKKRILVIVITGFATLLFAQNKLDFSLESHKSGDRLPNWSTGSTNSKGRSAVWTVQYDKKQKNNVYGITDLGDVNDGRFNLSWYSKSKFKNLVISVNFKAVSGKIDQGGGVVWRMQDQNNYYIARFNPLEDNFRIYTVRNANRKIVGSTRLTLNSSKWHSLQIKHNGNHIEGFINGKKLLDVTDKTFGAAGFVGLWTKADALTLFEKFSPSVL